jgi:anti-sigma factor ChrR (cupin superfamily)
VTHSGDDDEIAFDDDTLVALALATDAVAPGPAVRSRLLSLLVEPALPEGFALCRANEGWQPFPLPGIRFKVLSLDPKRDTATLLLEASPGSRFPPHRHGGAEECFIISGDVATVGRRLGPGDFLHADAHTDHGELSTVGGAVVLLVVKPEDYGLAHTP